MLLPQSLCNMEYNRQSLSRAWEVLGKGTWRSQQAAFPLAKNDILNGANRTHMNEELRYAIPGCTDV